MVVEGRASAGGFPALGGRGKGCHIDLGSSCGSAETRKEPKLSGKSVSNPHP